MTGDPLADTEAIPCEPVMPASPHRTCRPPAEPTYCAHCGVTLDGTEVQWDARRFCPPCAAVVVTDG